MPQSITKEQIAQLYATAGRLHMNDDAVHEAVLAMTGKSSIKQLSEKQGWYCIYNLKPNPPENTDISRHISKEVAWKLRQLQDRLDWTDKQLEVFVSKRFGIGKLEWLGMQMAQKVIEGMKAIAARAAPQKESSHERATGMDE
jgi:hypothetical protein